MRERRVLLDATFLHVLLDADDPAHLDTRVEFDELLGDYLRGGTVLYSIEPDSVEHRRPQVTAVIAVCEVVKMRRWLRRAAQRVIAANPDLAVGVEEAATVVVIERFRIGEVASVERLPAGRAVAVTRNSQHFRNWLAVGSRVGMLAR